MGGLFGIYNLQKKAISPSLIRRMGDVIKHRGPDGKGFYIKRNIGLGHQKLTTINHPENDRQPFSNKDKTLWIIHDGAIYNYPELKLDLKKHGYKFQSDTDTEVILHSYERWGVNCLNKFNGQWAFVLWDERKKQLFCAKDRFGIKPFYYYFDGKNFAFASEIKPLFSCPFIKKEPNPSIIFDYLALDYLNHSRQTFFRNIDQLEPASYLIISQEGKQIIKKYYSPPYNPDFGEFNKKKAEKYAQNFLCLLEDSIRLRIRSSFHASTSTSGGLDSLTILYLINKLLMENGEITQRQKVLTGTLDVLKATEKKYIENMVKSTGISPFFIHTSEKEISKENQLLIALQEEPLCGFRTFRYFFISKLAKRKGIRIVLNGEGGDEILGGHSKHANTYLNQLNFLKRTREFHREFKAFQRNNKKLDWNRSPHVLFMKSPSIAMRTPLKESSFRIDSNPLLSQFFNKNFLKEYWKGERKKTKKEIDPNLQKELLEDTLNLTRRFSNSIDKVSSAFSVENRFPYLDHRLVEFVFSLPACYKIHCGQTKYLLREATKNIISEKTRHGEKRPWFCVRSHGSFTRLTRTKKELKKVLSDKNFRATDFLNQKSILENLNLFSGDAIGSTALWKFMNLELWLKKLF